MTLYLPIISAGVRVWSYADGAAEERAHWSASETGGRAPGEKVKGH